MDGNFKLNRHMKGQFQMLFSSETKGWSFLSVDWCESELYSSTSLWKDCTNTFPVYIFVWSWSRRNFIKWLHIAFYDCFFIYKNFIELCMHTLTLIFHYMQLLSLLSQPTSVIFIDSFNKIDLRGNN